MQNFPFHVIYLKEELLRRQAKNPKYSLRAFAKNIQLHPSALSRILCCKQELSLAACIVLVPKIVFSGGDKEAFLVSVAEEKMHIALKKLAKALDVELQHPSARNAG